LFGFWTPCMLFSAAYGWAVPFFGVILNGVAGAAVVILVMLLLGYVSWGTYRLKINAWWCAASLVVAWGASATITFSRVSIMELYEKMNYSAEQLELMKSFTVTLEPKWFYTLGYGSLSLWDICSTRKNTLPILCESQTLH